MGPWHHGQEIVEGSTLGALKFDSDTALTFRQNVLAPFLAHYLKDDAAGDGRRAGDGVRDGNERLAAAPVVAACRRGVGNATGEALPRRRAHG